MADNILFFAILINIVTQFYIFIQLKTLTAIYAVL